MLVKNPLFNIKPITKSRWAMDAYKASMGYGFNKEKAFQGLRARSVLTDRSRQPLIPGFLDEFQRQLLYCTELPMDLHVADYMADQWQFIPKEEYWYWYARHFKFDMSQVYVGEKDGQPDIRFEGPLQTQTYWELFATRIYSELMTIFLDRTPKPGWQQDARDRARLFKERNVIHSFMGGRRSFSEQVLDEAIHIVCEYSQEHIDGGGLSGISWMLKAYQFGKRPMGSVAHEFYQICAGKFGYMDANRMAMKIWHDLYGDAIGYALPDTFRTKSFLQDLSYAYAMLIKAFRQDSGVPLDFVFMVLARLRELELEAALISKTLMVHSNFGIGDEQVVLDLNDYRRDLYRRAFGFGKIWDNNCGHPAPNVVCKQVVLILLDGTEVPLVKLGDDPGKESGEHKEKAKCKKTLGIKD